MGCYINADIGYYEGDQVSHLDVEVPQRPNPGHVWGGSSWHLAPDPVPASVTQSQARRALLSAGMLAAVEAAVAAADQDTKIVWQYAAAVERNSQFVAALASAIGLDDGQVDDLFRLAATFTG